MVGFGSLRDGACESCWLTRGFDMMNHSRIIEDMDAEGPTTPPPGSRTTILVSSLARCPCDLPERRVRAHAPFGTEPIAGRRAAMAARDFVKELLLSTSRPSRRSGIFCAERSRPLDQSSSSRVPSWYNQLAPRGLLGPLVTSQAPPSRPPGA